MLIRLLLSRNGSLLKELVVKDLWRDSLKGDPTTVPAILANDYREPPTSLSSLLACPAGSHVALVRLGSF